MCFISSNLFQLFQLFQITEKKRRRGRLRLGRNFLCPGARRGKKGGKRGKKRGKRRGALKILGRRSSFFSLFT
jgi:hypothetical protein